MRYVNKRKNKHDLSLHRPPLHFIQHSTVIFILFFTFVHLIPVLRYCADSLFVHICNQKLGTWFL